MKWRERISILSRKRKLGRNASVVETGNSRVSTASSSRNTGREDVEKTLSQIRPVIGPDHKSYYILLRGNEDSFTCIQPAKEVITSLDEVVKNVVNSVKQTKPQGTTVPSHVKAPFNNETRSNRNVPSRKYPDKSGGSGVLSPGIDKEIKVTRSADFESEEKFLGTENVVENVVLHRTVQTVNSSHNEVTRTSTLVYPLVQNHLDSSGTVLGIKKQDKGVLVSNKKSVVRDLPHAVGQLARQNKSSHAHTYVSFGKEKLSGTEKTNVSIKDEPVAQDRKKPEVQINEPLSHDVETTVPESVSEKTRPATEIRLVAKAGSVLTEEIIAEQVKTLIETGTLMIEENSHIMLIRENEEEVLLRISSKETENREMEEYQIKPKEIMQQPENKEVQSQTEEVIYPDSGLQEGLFHDPLAIDSSSSSSDTESRVQYLLASLSPSPHHMFDECSVKSSELEEIIKEHREESSNYCMIDPSVQEADPVEVERLLLNDSSLLNQEEGLVVLQKSDGTFISENGSSISDELQYLIASSLPEDQTLIPDSYVNHVFLSTRP